MEWKPGNRVTWIYAVSGSQSMQVPGIVRAATKRRVTVEVLFMIKGEPSKAIRHVKPDRLTARTQHVKELDDV